MAYLPWSSLPGGTLDQVVSLNSNNGETRASQDTPALRPTSAPLQRTATWPEQAGPHLGGGSSTREANHLHKRIPRGDTATTPLLAPPYTSEPHIAFMERQLPQTGSPMPQT